MTPDEREEYQRAMAEADVILGVDLVTGLETIFYGTPLMNLIAAGDKGAAGQPCRVLRVPIDFGDDSEEPEWLAAACRVIKGRCDMEGADS
jgi:hypothetical protein